MNLLSKIFRRGKREAPQLDQAHPLVKSLAGKLRALRALPIASKEERAVWYSEAERLSRKLRKEYQEIYDSLPHELEHYLVDADIRAKDAGYARYQEELLSELFACE
jgi:hypothetical protein